MAKKQTQPTKTCADCIHENACRMWVDGRYISDMSASKCPNHETVKESGAYLCGVLDERQRKQTNADRIRAMSDEELADYWMKCNCVCDWCVLKAKCDEDTISKDRCTHGVLEWLKQPAEGE